MSWRLETKDWLSLLAEQVLPDDDTPGAIEAGVDGYLERLIPQPRGRALSEAVEGILAALARRGGDLSTFRSLSFDARRQWIERALEAEPEAWRRYWRPFALYCLEGWLCDPSRGGNRALGGWRATGLCGPAAVGTADEA